MSNILLTIYNLHASIGVSNVGGTWTYAELAEGIDNVAEALNEVVQQYQFLSGGGFATNDITGMAPAWTLSGRRVFGDAAQDYIFSKKYSLGDERKSSLRITYTDASSGTAVNRSVTVGCTIVNPQEWNGASTDHSAISVEIRFNGKPTLSNVGVLGALTVVSVAGSAGGKTAIYVNPALTGSDIYEYMIAADGVTLPELGADPGAGWTAWDGSSDITATTGYYIGVVEVDTGGLAVKGGTAFVTSAS